MNKILFTQTKLGMYGKVGKIEPDADGYYELVVGGLNTFNNTNAWYYTLEGARELFGPGSILHRRIANGCLRAEVGHPKQKPGESNEMFFSRMLDIDMDNTCAHFKSVWLDENYGKNNPQHGNPSLVAIMALVKPTGPKAQMLKDALENPNENVCFSIRALADEGYVNGRRLRVLKEVITIDFVNEGGILIASKWDSPATESLDNGPILEITKKAIERIKAMDSVMATENSREIIDRIDRVYFRAPEAAVWSKW